MLKAEFLIGKQLDNEWSGIYGYKPEDLESSSEMFVAIRVAVAKDEFSLENIAKILLDELQASYYENSQTYEDKVERLEASIWKMKSKMEYILSREPALSEYGLDIEMAIAVFEEGILYLAVIGESKIYIQRGEKFVEISKGLVDASMRGFFKSGSIELQESDKIGLATSKAATRGSVALQLGLNDLDVSKLEELKNTSGVACLILADESLDWATAVEEEPEAKEVDIESGDPELVAETAVGTMIEEEESAEDISVGKVDQLINSRVQSNLPADELGEGEYSESVDEMRQEPPMKERLQALFNKGKGFAKDKFQQASDKVKEFRNRGGEVVENDVDSEPRFTNVQDEESEVEEMYPATESNVKDRVLTTVRGVASKTKDTYNNTVGAHFKNNQKTYARAIGGVGDRIKAVIQFIVDWFKREIIGTNDRRDKYMRGKKMRRNRVLLAVAIVVLVAVVFIGLRNAEENRRKQEQIDAAKAQITTFQNKLNSLSPQVLQAKTEGEQKKTLLLTELQKLTSDINVQKKNGLFTDELDKLAKDVQVKQDDLLLVVPVTDPKIVVDIGKNFPDATLSDIVYSNGGVFISDSARGVVYRVASTGIGAQPQIYATGLVQPYILVRNVDGDIIFYDNDTTSSIGKIKFNQEQSITRFQGLPPSSIGKPNESALYDGNNALYEVRQTNKQLFRRTQDGDGYIAGGAAPSTDDTNWRTDSDFGTALDLSVPRDIYVLIKNQGLKRYFAGGDSDITFETYANLLRTDFEALKQGTSLDVADGNVVIGDPVNRRVMLFKYEDGDAAKLNFVKQYVYKGSDSTTFSDIDEVVVVQSENAIFVLDGSKVIKLDM